MKKSPAPFLTDTIAGLFEHLPMVAFYMKDLDGFFIRCNPRFEEFHGLASGKAIGLNDFDLHPTEIASRYRAEDKKIMESDKLTPNRTWMVPGADGLQRWWLSSKAPTHDANGEVNGVAGVMYQVSDVAGMTGPFQRIEPALALIHSNSEDELTTRQLASACNYSESQFNRIFKQFMGFPPRQYILRHKLETSKGMLSSTDLPLSEIASRSGFYDASDFGKRFRAHEGITPRHYRMKLQKLITAAR